MISVIERAVSRITSAVTQAKKFPAYGKKIFEARQRGFMPRQAMVYIVLDWRIAKAYPRVVVDRDADFECLDFRFLAAMDAIIAHRAEDSSLVEPLARAILKSNPRRLQAWPLDPDDAGQYLTRFFKTADGSDHEHV